jgi:hypothetical protein
MVNRSVFSGNTNAGIVANGALAPTEVQVTNSASSNNGIGVQNGGGALTIRLSNNDISFNGHAILHQQPDRREQPGGHRPDPDRCDHQPQRSAVARVPGAAQLEARGEVYAVGASLTALREGAPQPQRSLRPPHSQWCWL